MYANGKRKFPFVRVCRTNTRTHTHACTHARTHAHTHTHARTHARTHAPESATNPNSYTHNPSPSFLLKKCTAHLARQPLTPSLIHASVSFRPTTSNKHVILSH